MVQKNKKASGVTVFLVISMIILIGAVVGGVMYLAKSPLTVDKGSVSTDSSKLKLTSISASIGTDYESNLEKLRIASADLNSDNTTSVSLNLTLLRDDVLEDLTTGGKKFTVKVSGLTGATSWNTSVSAQQYFVTYNAGTKKYTITVNGGSSGLLESVISVGTSSVDVPITFDVASLSTANSIVQNQYTARDIGKVEFFNDKNDLVESYGIEYFRTTATG